MFAYTTKHTLFLHPVQRRFWQQSMVEHIGEHLLIGCNVAIPRRKKGENPLSLEVKMEKNPALPVSQTRPCCSSPSEYQPFLSHTSSKVTILERAGGREERK